MRSKGFILFPGQRFVLLLCFNLLCLQNIKEGNKVQTSNCDLSHSAASLALYEHCVQTPFLVTNKRGNNFSLSPPRNESLSVFFLFSLYSSAGSLVNITGTTAEAATLVSFSLFPFCLNILYRWLLSVGHSDTLQLACYVTLLWPSQRCLFKRFSLLPLTEIKGLRDRK